MAGTIHGRIDCLANEASDNFKTSQAKFKTLFDFLSGQFTRIAWYKGDASGNIPGGASRGSDYWDGAAPFGQHAWALFRVNGSTGAHAWYLLITYLDGQNNFTLASGNGPASPCTLGGGNQYFNTGIGMQMAWAVDASGNDASPWNGSTNNNGADTKGTPVWTAPAGGSVHVLPRSNEPGGGFATNRENFSWLGSYHYAFTGFAPHRFHVVADSDSICFVEDYGDDGGAAFAYVGVYIPRPGLTVARPFVMINEANDGPLAVFRDGTKYGPITYGDMNRDGGIAGPDTNSSVRQLGKDVLYGFPNVAACNPNQAFNPVVFDEWAIPVGWSELNSFNGYLGTLDPALAMEINGVNNGDAAADLSRAFFGQSAQYATKYSIPWNGVTTPRTNATRQGVSF
jgi:hypothetical protein